MRLIDASQVAAALDYPSLIERIDAAFAGDITVPRRHHHTIDNPGGADPVLLLMPAWRQGEAIGVKMVAICPDNGARGLPSVHASYILLDFATGRPLAIIDGAELTARRTASASALASRYLSRPDSACLAMVGTGVLAPHLIRAHAAVRPIREVQVWGRNPDKAEKVAAGLAGEDFSVAAAGDLEAAVAGADIVSCATLATEPLIHGRWLGPGQHLDLVGGFTPEMREADDEAVRRAVLFVDTREGALEETGDLCDPIGRGVIAESDVLGDLFELAAGTCPSRRSDAEITLFKSAGTAIEDLAAAQLAFERA